MPEKFFVAAELVVLPEMVRVPCVRRLVPFPAHAAGDVVRSPDGESARGRSAGDGFQFGRAGRGFAPGRELALNQDGKLLFQSFGMFRLQGNAPSELTSQF